MLSNKVQAFIQKQKLFQATDRLLLAISGGMDSVVMLYSLLELGYRPALIHANFQLRTRASDLDEEFVKNLATQYKLPVFTRRFETAKAAKEQGQSIQMMAREQRYAYFEEIRSQHNYDYILTAHHLDDRIETFLLNFLRGTGFAGLRSIPVKNGFICRPLLCVNRQEILDYQTEHKIMYREDESNASDKYKRNFLRHHVVAQLYELTPQLAETARQNFDRFDQMYLLYQAQLVQLKKQMLRENEHGCTLDLLAIRSHPAKESLLWEFLKAYGLNREQLRQLLLAREGTLLDTDAFKILISREQLIIEKKVADTVKTFFWQENEAEIRLNTSLLIKKTLVEAPRVLKTPPSEILLDSEKLIYPLELRHWRAGDFFHPFGMNGHRQKLQDFFTNNKINRLDREKIWLLLNGDGRIIWLVGYRMDDGFSVQSGKPCVRFSSFPNEK